MISYLKINGYVIENKFRELCTKIIIQLLLNEKLLVNFIFLNHIFSIFFQWAFITFIIGGGK